MSRRRRDRAARLADGRRAPDVAVQLDDFDLDVLFLVGHDLHPGQEGAVGQGIPERYLMGAHVRAFVLACRAVGLRAGSIVRRDEVDGYDARQLDACARLARARFGIDLHFNSGGYPGSRALYFGEPSRALADAVARAFATAQGTSYRGVHAQLGADGVPRAWRSTDVEKPSGGELVVLTRAAPCITCVAEPFDGSVASDYAAGLAALQSGASARAVAAALRALVDAV